jgi:hypothetical protein
MHGTKAKGTISFGRKRWAEDFGYSPVNGRIILGSMKGCTFLVSLRKYQLLMNEFVHWN